MVQIMEVHSLGELGWRTGMETRVHRTHLVSAELVLTAEISKLFATRAKNPCFLNVKMIFLTCSTVKNRLQNLSDPRGTAGGAVVEGRYGLSNTTITFFL